MSELTRFSETLERIESSLTSVIDKVLALELINVAEAAAKKERGKFIALMLTFVVTFGGSMYRFVLVPAVNLTESNQAVAQAMENRTAVIVKLGETK